MIYLYNSKLHKLGEQKISERVFYYYINRFIGVIIM